MKTSSELRVQPRCAYFCTRENPYAVKVRVEKVIRFLLTRDDGEMSLLRFHGERPPHELGHRTTLQLLTASSTNGDCWEVRDEAYVEARWMTEDQFRRQSEQVFARWCAELGATAKLRKAIDDYMSLAQYAARITQYRELEAAALLAAQDDPAEVRALQEQLLSALRHGQTLSTANKEGGTIFGVKAGQYRESHYGEETGDWFYDDATEMLSKIRQHYDWDSRAGDYPHRPKEAQVWRFILGKLR